MIFLIEANHPIIACKLYSVSAELTSISGRNSDLRRPRAIIQQGLDPAVIKSMLLLSTLF